MPKGMVISPSDRAAMIAAYLSGDTVVQAAARFGYCEDSCRAAMRAAGVPPRNASVCQRRYAINDTFFKSIDSEPKAYWLGFLTADGCITKSGAIKLTLAHKDKKHVEAFRNAVGSTHPVKTRRVRLSGKTHKTAGLFVKNSSLVAQLERLGLMPRKSFTIKPCQHIPEHLLRHYWRGVVDGDGHVRIRVHSDVSSESDFHFALVGNRDMLGGFCDFVADVVSSRATIRPHARIYRIRYCGRAAAAVVELLYLNANVYLDRKKEVADKMLVLSRWSNTGQLRLFE